MSAHTDLIRSACDWIDRHPELPAPVVNTYPRAAGESTVDLSWHLARRHDIDQTEAAKEILATVGGTWTAAENMPGVVALSGPVQPFRFYVYVTAALAPQPIPADLEQLGVTQ